MKIDLGDLLSRTDEIMRENKKRTFAQPTRAFVYFNFLTPVGWRQQWELQHFYEVVPRSDLWTDKHFIIHGHDKWTSCATPHYCHLINYQPGPEYNPSFRKQFDLKWKAHYQ